MRTECTRNCWIVGGAAGLVVCLSIALFGGAGWSGGIVMGLLTAWMLGGTLVWGLCQGAGTRADNESLLAGGWADEPFTPTRRVVGAGGEVIAEEPLAAAERIPGGAPLDSRTLTPSRDAVPAPGGAEPARTRPAAAALAVASTSGPRHAEIDDPSMVRSAPIGEGQIAHSDTGPVEGFTLEEPDLPGIGGEARTLHSTGFVEPRTDSEAGLDPHAPEGGIEPLVNDPAAGRRKDKDKRTRKGAKAEEPSGKKAKGKAKDKDKKKAKKAAVAARPVAAELSEGERVATITGDAEPASKAVAGSVGGEDDLARIRGIGPMLKAWLAGYGVTRFEQIAAWDDADVARYAGMMGRMGHRIRGEDWVGQARLLAAGGETAHSHAVDTGEAD